MKKTDVENDGLKGKVKNVREISYDAIDKSGKLSKGEINSNTFVKYDG
jgi:hypothetical protein